MNPLIKLMHSRLFKIITSTPCSRKNSSFPPKFTFSPTTTRGIPNCTIVPLHIMQGLNVVKSAVSV